MRARWWTLLIGVVVFTGWVTPLSSQGSLSEQVLRLLTRNNYWSGTQTFARTVGVTLESGTLPPGITANTLYNIGGNLYFNGTLVSTTAGVGTVTSVGLSLPGIFTVSGSPVVSSGTLTATLASQAQNLVWASPDGSGGTPTFRALVAADLPPISSGSITGVIPVANGGTGLSSGTSGGVLAYTAAGTLASSAALTANRIVVGGGAGAAPTVLGSLGTTTTVLHGNAAGAPTFGAVSLTADVTGTLPFANGGTGLASGTSGGLLYFSSTTTIGSSALLDANQLVLGGGAGTAPATLGSLGTATQVLRGNASGAPTWGAVTLSTMVTGTLPVTNGGTGLATLAQGDLLYASAANTISALAKNTTATRYLSNTGTSNNPAWAQINLASGVTGTLPLANGGTGATGTPTNGQLLIGNGAGFTLATLTGTANQVVVTNGAGTSTLSLPQSIATTSTPQWARIGLGTGAGATAVLTTTGQFDVGYFSDGNCGAADTINWNQGQVHTSTLTAASCTYTFSNPIIGANYVLAVVQDGTGGRIVTWPANVQWQGGITPALSITPGATDICRFVYDGTNYQGWCPAASVSIFSARVTLTNAQILALPTTPVVVVPAQGASNRIGFISASIQTSLAAAYTNVDTDAILSINWGSSQSSTAVSNRGLLTYLDQLLTNSVSTTRLAPFTVIDSTPSPSEPTSVVYPSAFANTALSLTADNDGSGDWTGGNAANEMTVIVYYFVTGV